MVGRAGDVDYLILETLRIIQKEITATCKPVEGDVDG